MINIRKGNHNLKVSKDTYESMFKILGYTIVNEEAEKKASSENNNVENKKEDNNSKKNNSKENKELDNFLDDVTNLSGEEEKTLENENNDKEDNNSKENKDDKNLENILGMLSNNSKKHGGK